MAQNETQRNIRATNIDNAIVSNIDNGIIVLDDELNIYAYNKWLEIYTKISEKDAVGKKLDTLFPQINTRTLIRKIKATIVMGTPSFYIASASKYLIPIKLNQLKNYFFTYMQQDVSIVLYNADEKKVFLIITDQTTMTHTQALLKENILKVEELNINLLKEKKLVQEQHEKLLSTSRSAAMGEMISMIAHQWRQPLSVINTAIAIMKVQKNITGTITDETQIRSFNQIEKTVVYLSDTINDFRDYFKPNKDISEVNLSNIFNKSIFFLETEMQDLNISYQHDIDTELTIRTYKNELLQSIINIIKNSIDAFNEKKIVDKYIKILLLQSDNKHIIINIEDNAGGIEPKILKNVFEPYFSTKNKNGTGLGLYMTQTIINEHLEGNIDISSQENKTIVTIKLPKNKDK